MILPVGILVGGLATRLRPITEKIPKALIKIGGQPFIAHQLKLLKKNNIERVVLCAGYFGELIRDVVGNGNQFGLHVEYSFDGPVLLGTGGALRKALPLLGDEFFVLYGDSYLDCDYHAVQLAFESSGKPALMTIFHNENRWGKSNVLCIDHAIVKYDKKNPTPEMKHLDYGLGVLKSSVFKILSGDQRCDLSNIYRDLASRGELAGFEVAQRFYEIGSKKGLAETRRYLEKLS
jgi:N-acetyl-alpha-D-muramate 1-phosphate uridylyltransferase